MTKAAWVETTGWEFYTPPAFLKPDSTHRNGDDALQAVSGKELLETVLTQEERPTLIADGMVLHTGKKGKWRSGLLFAPWLLCNVTSYLKLSHS